MVPASRVLKATLLVDSPPLPQAAKKSTQLATKPSAAPIAPALAATELIELRAVIRNDLAFGSASNVSAGKFLTNLLNSLY